MSAWLLRLSRPHQLLRGWRWQWGSWDVRVTYDLITALARFILHRHEMRGITYVALWPTWQYDICMDGERRTVAVFPILYAVDTNSFRRLSR